MSDLFEGCVTMNGGYTDEGCYSCGKPPTERHVDGRGCAHHRILANRRSRVHGFTLCTSCMVKMSIVMLEATGL